MCYVSKLLLRFHYANLLFLLLYSPSFDEKSKQRCVKNILLPFGYNIFVLLQANTLVLRYDGISLSLLLNKISGPKHRAPAHSHYENLSIIKTQLSLLLFCCFVDCLVSYVIKSIKKT